VGDPQVPVRCASSRVSTKPTWNDALLWLISFDSRQQFFLQRSPEPREPLNFYLKTIEVLGNLAEPLNLGLETIDEIDDANTDCRAGNAIAFITDAMLDRAHSTRWKSPR
jgi:hypothetical protein